MLRNDRNGGLLAIRYLHTAIRYTLGHGANMIGQVCGRVGLALVLGAGMLAAQQPTTASQRPAANATSKRTVRSKPRTHRRKAQTSEAKIPVEVMTGGTVRTEMLDAQPSGSAQKTPGRTTVEEMNGGQKNTRVFSAPEQKEAGVHRSETSRAGKHRTKTTTQPATESVEVINGRTSYTTTFREASGQTKSSTNQRVVTGIESNRMRAGVEKSQPVVIGVSSGEQESSNTKPVVVSVSSSGVASNRPVEQQAPAAQRRSKRRPYVPNPPSR